MNNNICKFYTPTGSDPILIHCFVLESSPESVSYPTLQRNRMLLITQGQGALLINNSEIKFRMGSLIFAFPGESFALAKSEDAAFLYVDFSGIRSEELLQRFGINPGCRAFDDFGGMIPLWKESLLCASPETIDLAAESVLLHTLSRMKREKAEQNDIVTLILKIIENNFNDSSLSIASVGEELSYHPKYLSHIFKKEMGVGFSEYLRNKRINYARTLFDHGLDSIKNVAFLSGFSDPLYFSNVFKKVTGTSPTVYLQKQESDQE